MKKAIAEGRIEFQKNKNGDWIAYEKIFAPLEGEEKTKKYTTWIEDANDGANVVKGLFDTAVFDYPKTPSLIKRFLQMGNVEEEELVLDFFSGSATTAHAMMQMNAEDGGKRKFIMVQLPEVCAEDSEAAKAGYKNICEIGKERIRRAGRKIAPTKSAENAERGQGDLFNPSATSASSAGEVGDIGFRVLKLDSSSLNDTALRVGAFTQENLGALDRIKSDRSAEDLLFQMLLETHIPLSERIVKAEVGGNEVWFVGIESEFTGVPLLACLDPAAKMTTEFFMEVAKLKPGIAFFRDDAFADDSARTNLQQMFNQFSPATSIKVI